MDPLLILAIVLMSAIMTYSGVSVFVVVFTVYPFAANLFQEANIPKRLIPGTIALGAFSFTMERDSLRYLFYFQFPLIKPYVKFSLIRLSDVLLSMPLRYLISQLH